MTAMPRQMMQYTDPQLKWLRKEAALVGLSVPELVRRIIDEYRDHRHEGVKTGGKK